MLALTPALLGLVVGLVMGTLGGGGGIITVPMLVGVFGLSPYVASTASLIIVGASALTSALAHARNGNVNWKAGIAFGVLGIVGSFAGSYAAKFAPSNLLLGAFAVLLLTVAVLMWRRTERKNRVRRQILPPSANHRTHDPITGDYRPDPHRTGPAASILRRHPWRIILAATGIGALTGFFGVGGGFVVVPTLVILLRFSMPKAVGTSLVVIFIGAMSSLSVRLSSGIELNWSIVAAFTLTTIIGSLVGVRISGRFSPRSLSRAFIVLLSCTAIYTAAQVVL